MHHTLIPGTDAQALSHATSAASAEVIDLLSLAQSGQHIQNDTAIDRLKFVTHRHSYQ
jgi:hypothetical protein